MSTARCATIANDSPLCESREEMKKLEDDLISVEAMNAPLHSNPSTSGVASRVSPGLTWSAG